MSCILFLDLKKAFDSVSHHILLKKMEYYGVRGVALDLFKSYLTNRKQLTKVDDCTSVLDLIEWGVPQGRVLGPLDTNGNTFLFWKKVPFSENLFSFR